MVAAMNINAVVKLNYLAFFCTVVNFLTCIDPVIDRTVSAAYELAVPGPVADLITLLWPFGFSAFVYFVAGVAIVFNIDALSQVVSPVEVIRSRMMATAKTGLPAARLYAEPPPGSPRTTRHIADYVRKTTPVIYPKTDEDRIVFTFPNEEDVGGAGGAGPPVAQKGFVVLSNEEIAHLQGTDDDDYDFNPAELVANDDGTAEHNHEVTLGDNQGGQDAAPRKSSAAREGDDADAENGTARQNRRQKGGGAGGNKDAG